MKDINTITWELGVAYREWKDSEVDKNTLKEEFFKAATESFDWASLATQVVPIQASSYDDAKAKVLKKYPAWKVRGVHLENDTYFVGLEEDREYKSFSYVNTENKMVFQRSVVEGAIMCDDDSVKQNDPELWEAITREVTTTKMIPMDEMEPWQLERIAPYIYQLPPSVKLLAPRRAKEEELDEE